MYVLYVFIVCMWSIYVMDVIHVMYICNEHNVCM
jgi:hypothetical protein